jgi:hypothetical protein
MAAVAVCYRHKLRRFKQMLNAHADNALASLLLCGRDLEAAKGYQDSKFSCRFVVLSIPDVCTCFGLWGWRIGAGNNIC